MKKFNHLLAGTFLASTFLLTNAVSLSAQEQQATSRTVDEIIVTARKQSESLQEVPVAVTALTSEMMDALNIKSIDDIARQTPGLVFSRAYGKTTERPVMRGAANILAGVQYGVESGTAYFIDGQYYSRDLQALDMNMIERVEVIKGPQSALYGRNSYAGAINFITRKPSDSFTVHSSVEVAEHNSHEVYLGMSGPLRDNVFASLSFKNNEYGGEIKNAADNFKTIGDEKNTTFNGALTFQLSDITTLTARLLYTEDDDGPRPFALQHSSQNNCYPGYRSDRYRTGFFATGTTNTNQYYCGVIKQPEFATQNTNGSPFQGVDREMTHISLALSTEMAGHDVSVRFANMAEDRITGADSDHYDGALNLGPGNAFLNTHDLDEYEDTSLEVTFSSQSDGPLNYMVGLFTYDYERKQTGYDLAAAPSVDKVIDEITNDAIFAMIEYDVTDRFSAAFEARYSEEEKKGFERATGGDVNGSVSFDTFSPRAVFNYKASDDLMVYASYSEGTKPGGFNGANGVTAGIPDYDEEEVEATEIGIKSTLLGGKLTANVSVYSNDISKYQLTTPVASNSGNVTSIATNQGDVEVKGLELDFAYRPTDNLRLGLTYAYTDAEIIKGCDDFQFTLTSGGFLMAPFDINDPTTWNLYRESTDGGISPTNDPDGFYEAGKGNCSIAGKKAPMTAEDQLSAYIQMDFPMASGPVFYINADAAYESSKFVQVHNMMETGSSMLVGAQMGIRGDSWDIRLFGTNLTDEDSIAMATRWFDMSAGFAYAPYNGAGIDNGFLGPRGPFVSFRKGRQIGLKITKSF